MAQKPIAEQFKVFVFSRPNDASDAGSGSGHTPYDEAQDTLLVSAGTYNRPANPGEVVFTSENAAVSAGMAAVRRFQQGLGQNARFQVNGQPCGADVAGAARNLTVSERRERIYIMGDTISAGLHDAIKYANRVPDTGSLTVRSEQGPEVPVQGDPAQGVTA